MSSGTRKATEQRFAERAAQARGQRWRRWLVGSLVVVLLVAIGYLFWLSPVFAVRDVEVTGSSGLTTDVIEEEQEQEIGRPLLQVDLDDLESRILERSPGAKEVTAERSWPHTINLDVTLRDPELAVATGKGTYRVLDIEGVEIGTESSAPKGVPTVTAEEGATVSEHGVKAASSMLREMPDDLRGDVSAVTVDGADQVSFRLGGTTVVWGDASSPDVKVRVIPVLLEKKPKVIDVSAPDTPVTRG
ncbi:MAG TPA: FtsQ-type POTRA domain-containing protein [Candidatus Janibacter merdipullorum]|nr:FtsQ-type POTRA domain-containing protein [Candidatus Janibacter merdipullorum]